MANPNPVPSLVLFLSRSTLRRICTLVPVYLERDFTCIRIFNGIIQDIYNHLSDTNDITVKAIRKTLINFGYEFEVLLLGLEIDHVADIIDN